MRWKIIDISSSIYRDIFLRILLILFYLLDLRDLLILLHVFIRFDEKEKEEKKELKLELLQNIIIVVQRLKEVEVNFKNNLKRK